MPKTDKEEPKRHKARRERDDPKCKKSSTLKLLPKRLAPQTAKFDPNLENDLSDILLPRWRKSRTLIALPKRPKLRRLNELPRCTKSNTDIENTEPNFSNP